jgi:hypothetical protein
MLTDPNENATTPDPFSISNGFLIIQAYQDPTINNHWRSGLLSSADYQGNGFSQALGYKTPTPVSALGPLYVMVDFALGGGWPVDISSPTYMYVNYVCVYSP